MSKDKNLTLRFIHDAKCLNESFLVNGEVLLTDKNKPTKEKIVKAAEQIWKTGSSINLIQLAKTLAESDEDGIDLAITAIICGDLLVDLSPSLKRGALFLFVIHLSENKPVSTLIERVQEQTMRKWIDDLKVNHNEMYIWSTLTSLITLGGLLAIEDSIIEL